MRMVLRWWDIGDVKSLEAAGWIKIRPHDRRPGVWLFARSERREDVRVSVGPETPAKLDLAS